MQIVLARIDDRLIHGQVVVGWVTYTGANHIVVINDAVAKNEMQRTLFEIAVPVHLKVSICTVDDALSKINNVKFKNDKALLLFTNPLDVEKLLGISYVFKSLNVGGMKFYPGKKEVFKSVYLSVKDATTLLRLHNCGIEVEGRMVPTDKKMDIVSYIKNHKENFLGK